MTKSLASWAFVASLVVVLGGCSNDMLGSPGTSGELPAPITESAAPQFEQPFDANDVMFAQMMIPHHSQAVELATLAESNTTTPAIRDLAARIKGAQQPEIDLMTAWLVAAGAMVDAHGAHGMSMPGLVSGADMAALEQATGVEFDALFLTHMIQHHDGAIVMANDVLATTANDDVAALATAIVAAQTAEIADMYALLGP